jgi:hypothetical protein
MFFYAWVIGKAFLPYRERPHGGTGRGGISIDIALIALGVLEVADVFGGGFG